MNLRALRQDNNPPFKSLGKPRKLAVLSVFDAIGGTPLVPLSMFKERFGESRVSVKLEYLNPGGSLKDRPVSRILQKALQSGELGGGRTILDSSSGNAGIAYALYGAALEIPVRLVVPGNASAERLARIRAHGAKITLTDPLEGYDEAIREAHRIHEADPQRYFFANQYENKNNWLAHYHTTAEEILQQAPEITHFVGGVGTGGSLTGIARKLKERIPNITIVAISPERFPGIEGLKPLGESGDIVPAILDSSLIDKRVEVTSEQARFFCLRLAKEGFFAGSSSGAYLAGVNETLREKPNARIVTLLNDTGERYLSAGLWE